MASSVVLIIGALTGIGRATAFAFARIGAQLVVSGRHDETGRSLAGELREAGAEAEFVRADVRVEDEVRVLVDRAIARFGRLDIAVNNAGTEGQICQSPGGGSWFGRAIAGQEFSRASASCAAK